MLILCRTAVGGCEYGDRDDPGNLQLDWLEVQLETYRERGMQVRHCWRSQRGTSFNLDPVS